MNIVFMGSPDFSAGILNALCEGPYPVTGVVTQPDRAKGRHGDATPCPAKAEAMRRGIRTFSPEKVRDPSAIREVLSMEPDVIVVAAFGQIIPNELLTGPRFGCLNVHASLLPAYRGATPIQHAILDGCEKTGVTIMQMDEGLDTGDILTQQSVPIDPLETSDSLFEKLMHTGAELLMETLPAVFDGTCRGIKQSPDSPTAMTRRLKKEDGRIDWSRPARELERLIRAMYSWPCAFTTMDGKILKIFRATIEKGMEGAAPGDVIRTGEDGITIQTGDGALKISELQLEGKKRMIAADFLRGQKDPVTSFGS